MKEKQSEVEGAPINEESNPLMDTFVPIDVADLEEEYENLKLKPIPAGTYKVEITGYEVSLSGPNSKTPGTPMVRFSCIVVEDTNADLNGRKLQSQRYMLSGGGFVFFLRFAKAVKPTRLVKKSVRILEESGKSAYLDSYIRCTFVCQVVPSKDQETGEENGFNEITKVFGA